MAISLSGVAVRIRRSVAALEADLVRAHAVGLEEEPGVQLHASRADIDLDHPAADAVRIELVIPGRVETVRELEALAVPADLDHLRTALQRLRGVARMRRAADDPAQPEGADLLRVEAIGHVLLDEFTRAPARDVEET